MASNNIFFSGRKIFYPANLITHHICYLESLDRLVGLKIWEVGYYWIEGFKWDVNEDANDLRDGNLGE